MKENRPGTIERFTYLSRNVEVAIAGIAIYFGHLGVAALAAIGAVIDHKVGKHFEDKRQKPQTA